jgi:hypothetical protein
MTQPVNFVCLLTKPANENRQVSNSYTFLGVTGNEISNKNVLTLSTEFIKFCDILFNAGLSGDNFNHFSRYYIFVTAISQNISATSRHGRQADEMYYIMLKLSSRLCRHESV